MFHYRQKKTNPYGLKQEKRSRADHVSLLPIMEGDDLLLKPTRHYYYAVFRRSREKFRGASS